MLGAVLIVGLIFLLIARPNLPGFNFNIDNAQLQNRHIEAPLANIQTVNATFDFDSGDYHRTR
ncbi:MAG: hypothetical protein U0559_05210 [Anaerolineae bacterium]